MTLTPTRRRPPAKRPDPVVGGSADAPDEPMLSRRRLWPPPVLASVAVGVALVALAFAWRRLSLGTDLNDEGFYVAVPYRMALGARPFVDEMNVLQTAQFFVYPFVKLYVWLTGGAQGIVLFTRHLYLVWTVLVSAIAWFGLKKLVRWEQALLACLVCSTFVFVSTTNFSYNTLGAGLLVIGMGLGARALDGGRLRFLAAAGVAQALAAFAYPTLVVALPAIALCVALAMPERRRRALCAWCLGALTTLALEAVLLASFGVSNVMRSLRWQITGWDRLNDSGGPTKLWGVVHGAIGHVELYPWVIVAALVVWLAYRRWPVCRVALALAPLALLPFGEQLVSAADGFGVVYGLAAPFFYLFVPVERRAQAKRLLLWGYCPALAAGLVSGYSSANGWLQTDVGLLPAMVLSGVFLALALAPRESDPGLLRRLLPSLAVACLSGILAVTVTYQYQFLPRAVPYSQLTVTMRSGPYAGVRTTSTRAAYLEQLSADLRRTTKPSDRLLVFYQEPAFYLFWPGRVAANTVWVASSKGLTDVDDPGPLPAGTLDYYRRENTLPDVIVRVIDAMKLSPQELEQHYTGGLHYRLVLRRPQYAIFRRPAGVTTLAQALSPAR